MSSDANPYEPPSAEAQVAEPAKGDTSDYERRRRALAQVERETLMIGSVIAAVGVVLLGKAIPQLPNIDDRVTGVMVGVTLAEGGLRVLAGALVWKLRASGRILHAIAVGFSLLLRVGGELLATGKIGNATAFLLGPPLVLYVLWRKPAREVFGREYREKVVPVTKGPALTKEFWMMHLVLAWITAQMLWAVLRQ